MTDTDLKPCHVCGGKPRISGCGTLCGYWCMVTHAEADHSVWISAEAETKEQAKALAIEKWNTRHYPPEVEKAVERMKPKKVIRHQWSDNSKGFLALHCDYNCPVCDGELEDMVDFCPHEGCGQALDWSE